MALLAEKLKAGLESITAQFSFHGILIRCDGEIGWRKPRFEATSWDPRQRPQETVGFVLSSISEIFEMPVEVWRTTYFGNTNAGQRERDRYRNDAAANLGVNTDDGSAEFGQRRAGFGRDGSDNTGTVVLIARDKRRLIIEDIQMLCDFANTFHDVARSGRVYRQQKGLPPDAELQEEDRDHMRYYLDKDRYMRDFESHKKLRKDIYERIARGDADEDVRNVARQRWQERLGDRVKEPRGDIMDICGETPPPYEREKSEEKPSFGLG